jgi:hypothetical protein
VPGSLITSDNFKIKMDVNLFLESLIITIPGKDLSSIQYCFHNPKIYDVCFITSQSDLQE